MSDKIKLLFLSAQPCGSTPLRTDWELRDVDARIQAGLKPNRFEVAFAPALKRTDLQDALMRHRPQVVHFSGHSDATKGILLENDRGREAYVSGSELAELFAILRGTIRIVVLNSCDSSAIARQFQHFIDYTVAMNRPISDAAAIVFATAFYNALAKRQRVPTAFALAVNQLRLEKLSEFDAPQLFVGAGAPVEAEPEAPPKQRGKERTKRQSPLMDLSHATVRGHVITVDGDGNVIITG